MARSARGSAHASPVSHLRGRHPNPQSGGLPGRSAACMTHAENGGGGAVCAPRVFCAPKSRAFWLGWRVRGPAASRPAAPPNLAAGRSRGAAGFVKRASALACCVSLWVWMLGCVVITVMLVIYSAFLGSALQAQWDVMDHRLRGARDTSKAFEKASKPESLRQTPAPGHGVTVGAFGVFSEVNDLKLVQEWITQLPEIDATTRN